MKKFRTLAILTLIATVVTGCFSIIRVPMGENCEWVKDEKTGEWVKTNVVTVTCPNFPMCIYPTLHLRYHLFAFAWQEAPEGYHWRHYSGPLAGIVSCIGLPGDFLVDTIALPWDWDASETASCPMCHERGTWNNPVPEDAPAEDGFIIRINGTRVK